MLNVHMLNVFHNAFLPSPLPVAECPCPVCQQFLASNCSAFLSQSLSRLVPFSSIKMEVRMKGLWLSIQVKE